MGSSLALCACLFQTPPRGPFLTRSLPCTSSLGDAKAVRGLFEKNPHCTEQEGAPEEETPLQLVIGE